MLIIDLFVCQAAALGHISFFYRIFRYLFRMSLKQACNLVNVVSRLMLFISLQTGVMLFATSGPCKIHDMTSQRFPSILSPNQHPPELPPSGFAQPFPLHKHSLTSSHRHQYLSTQTEPLHPRPAFHVDIAHLPRCA